MGLEYIVHPQVFLGGLTALGPGIQGLTEQYPLLTTYNYWTSTASVDASAFPIPGTWSIYDNPNNSASFIVTVGGLVQTPDTYSINIINRLLTFNSTISAGIEIGATQLATAAPSSISYDYIESVNSNITNLTATSLTAIDGSIENLFVTNLTALSTTVNVIDIQYSELSGFDVTGNVNVFGNINVTDSLNLTGSFTANDINIATVQANDITTTNLTATDLVISNPVNELNINSLTATNATVTDLTVTELTANNVTVNGNVSASGAVKAVNTWPNRQSNILVNDGVQIGANTVFEVYSVLPTIKPNNIYEASFYVTISARVANPNIAFQLSGSAPFTILGGQAWGDTYTTAGGQPYTVVDLEATYGLSGPSTVFLLLPSATYSSPINAVNGFNITTILSSDSTLQLQISGFTNQVSRVKGRTLYNINLLQSV